MRSCSTCARLSSAEVAHLFRSRVSSLQGRGGASPKEREICEGRHCPYRSQTSGLYQLPSCLHPFAACHTFALPGCEGAWCTFWRSMQKCPWMCLSKLSWQSSEEGPRQLRHCATISILLTTCLLRIPECRPRWCSLPVLFEVVLSSSVFVPEHCVSELFLFVVSEAAGLEFCSASLIVH